MNIPTFAAIKQQIHKHIFYMRLNNIKKVFLASAALLSAMSMSAAERFVSFKQGDLLINANDKVEIYMDANDCRGVSYAANALVRDISKVSGSQATITSNRKATILVGTIGHSAAIDQLIKQKRINGNLLKGKREKFIITVVDKQLVIAGSDRRGTIYGIYELSQQMGVSPWYDWADVPVEHHDSIFVNKGIYTDGEPAVRYRGIFLNDEAPCLTSWVKNTYGTEYGDHRFYQRVFELVLRLRGNMMWPAMWGWAFYADDAENEKTADEMGVVMSTSHHEPMARNHQEYARNRKGWGPWNYQKNKANLQKFFREGIERKHKGGWGLYYHVDYVGAPRNSKMLNVTPVQNPWEQLTLAYENGIDRLWILNVGDLKPMEYPISQFMDMAWNPRKYDVNSITRHTRDWCAQQFGESQADEAARILNLICKYNGRCTPEMLNKNTYNLENGEWQEVVNQYLKIEADALRQYNSLPAAYHDAYRQIILFPTELMSNLHQMYFAQAQNHALYKQNNPKANIWADECERFFKRDSLICHNYNHKMSGGKWNGMMTQKHIGYKSWNDDFEKDTCPELFRVTSKDGVIISENNGVVEIEAPYYSSKTDAAEAKWTEIPFMGKSVAGMTLMPYTKSVKGASITYKFKMQVSKTSDGKTSDDKAFNGNVSNGKQKVRIHVITKSTLDYLNKGGLTYGVSLDGASPVEVNFNKDLNEKPENIYNIYYPTIATRIVDQVIELELPATADGIHTLTLTLTPNDPAIVFEKIVIDGREGKQRVKVI